MGDVWFRSPTPADIDELDANLRQADRDELMAAFGQTRGIIADGLAASTHSFAAVRDGKLVCLWGFAPLNLLAGEGMPWMLGTDETFRIARTLTRTARLSCAHVAPIYPRLFNYVDARNTASIRWLRHVGFTVGEAVPYGLAQLPFHLFEMRQ